MIILDTHEWIWWVQAEAIVGFWNAFQMSGDTRLFSGNDSTVIADDGKLRATPAMIRTTLIQKTTQE